LIVFLYGISENLRNYGTDQNYVQRVLCSSDDKSAKKSIWFGALAYLPISAIFCLIGTGLMMLYRVPVGGDAAGLDALISTPLPEGIKDDQVFPHFMRFELSPFARGIVIAGILAAAMSTVDSCLNSMSVTLYVDLWRRLKEKRSSIPDILIMRGFTLLNGILGTGLAIVIYVLHQNQSGALMNAWWKYAGVAGSGMFGLFLLAWLMPRIPSWVAVVAVVSSVPVLVWGALSPKLIHGNLVGISGFATMLLIGLVAQIAVNAGKLPANPRYKES
jgi:SSS family solute:Na+ symporter